MLAENDPPRAMQREKDNTATHLDALANAALRDVRHTSAVPFFVSILPESTSHSISGICQAYFQTMS